MGMHRKTQERIAAENAPRKARERKRQEEAAKEADREEKKLLKELDELEAKGKVDPPPELSPSERKDRELVERLDRLEGDRRRAQVPLDRYSMPPLETPEQHRRKEALRLLRIRRDYERQEKYERELGISSRQKKAEDEQDAITKRRNATLQAIDARAQEERQQATEQAVADTAAAWEGFERDAAARLERADPEVRQLLERLNDRLRGLTEKTEVVAA